MNTLDTQVYDILHGKLELPQTKVEAHLPKLSVKAKRALVADFDSQKENTALSSQKLRWTTKHYGLEYTLAMLESYTSSYRNKPGKLLDLAIHQLHPSASMPLTGRTTSH